MIPTLKLLQQQRWIEVMDGNEILHAATTRKLNWSDDGGCSGGDVGTAATVTMVVVVVLM